MFKHLLLISVLCNFSAFCSVKPKGKVALAHVQILPQPTRQNSSSSSVGQMQEKESAYDVIVDKPTRDLVRRIGKATVKLEKKDAVKQEQIALLQESHQNLRKQFAQLQTQFAALQKHCNPEVIRPQYPARPNQQTMLDEDNENQDAVCTCNVKRSCCCAAVSSCCIIAMILASK